MGRKSYSKRKIVEDCLILPIKVINQFMGNVNNAGKCIWPDTGNEIGIIYDYENDTLIIFYEIVNCKEPIKSYIYIIKQPCNYGNYRYYFACPKCKKKVYKLYKHYSEAYFTCRKCQNLTYIKQKKHNKSDDKWRSFEYLKKIAKLQENETYKKTAKERREYTSLYNKFFKLSKKYAVARETFVRKLEAKTKKITEIYRNF